ncbi:Mediator of RNA polymerase II transcription subunita [Sesamum angolense]|uniref:Mediator of RNA polymerase II transcription subunit 7 n=1 Tax=Sesamum angolense TaxID=2727404 RepID=A0AAE1WEH4_9LAMI|nr:Mediator of RNA polymerase II transcription subunita [Sesamum angolense]
MATATYPPPPPYYRLYKEYLKDPDSAPAPPPPIEGPYVLYGANYTVEYVVHLSGANHAYAKSISTVLSTKDQLNPKVYFDLAFHARNSQHQHLNTNPMYHSCLNYLELEFVTDDVLPGLEEQGVRQLYPKGPNIDFKKELTALNRELQLHLLELADVLVERPSQYARRVEDISLIFKNLHHVLNSLRPHQARATLIHILELQIQRRKQAVEDIKRRREEAQRLLKEALGTLDGQ